MRGEEGTEQEQAVNNPKKGKPAIMINSNQKNTHFLRLGVTQKRFFLLIFHEILNGFVLFVLLLNGFVSLCLSVRRLCYN